MQKISILLLFSLLFFMAAMFKSFILTTLPLFVFYFLYLAVQKKSWIQIRSLAIFSLFFATLTLPFGLYNLKKHGSYIISSNGGSYLFLNSNSEVGYMDGVLYDTLPKELQYKVKNFPDYGSDFFGPKFEEILRYNQKEKQKAFLEMSFLWIKENPKKFMELKCMNFLRFLMPGVSWMHFPTETWLMSVLAGLPAHFFGYLGIFLVLRSSSQRKEHAWLLGYVACMAITLVTFLYTDRYKVYGLEFVYIIYAGFYVNWLYERFFRRKILGFR